MLLERAKREQSNGKDSVFIRECSIHPDLFVVLASERQLNELDIFCTNPLKFTVFGADPTLIQWKHQFDCYNVQKPQAWKSNHRETTRIHRYISSHRVILFHSLTVLGNNFLYYRVSRNVHRLLCDYSKIETDAQNCKSFLNGKCKFGITLNLAGSWKGQI